MKENQDNKGNQPTDNKVFQPATVNEIKKETPAADQTKNPAINKGKQQDVLPEQTTSTPSTFKKITDTPETPKREEDPIKGETTEVETNEEETETTADEPQGQD
jgi:hypothetical protein